jgi:hypothetical protein
MKKSLVFIFALVSGLTFSQHEIILYNAAINEFDVYGEEAYEKYNRTNQDITEKVQTTISTTSKAEPSGGNTFEPKNLLDGNMKTCWMSATEGIYDNIELIVDLEEVDGVNKAQLNYIYFYTGWRKDLATWKEYSRIKKVTMSVNDLPYAEIQFENSYKLQSIDLDDFKIDRTRRCRIKFRIAEVYPGTKYKQVALSDIQLIGKAK